MNGCACCRACQPAPGRPRGRRGRWTRGAVAPTYRANAADRAAVEQPKAPQPRPSICRPTRIGGSSDLPRGSSFAEQNAAIALRRALVCSTPFGITEYIGHLRHDSAVDRARVLNAFRHHGVYRSREGPASLGRSCAQRLSASRSISEGDPAGDRPDGPQVLNAFRHHGVYRDGDGARPGGARHVLNAFRHHGVYRRHAVQIGGPAVGAPVCSTPFGITEYIGPDQLGDAADRQGVLNAFRHHGVYRGSSSIARSSHSSPCSTPFGITEYIGPRGERVMPEPVVCSTPFGITEYIGEPGAHDAGHAQHVLNAFRHHGVYRPQPPSRPSDGPLSAQRLSASRSISASGHAFTCRYARMCSTPFGITEYIGRVEERRKESQLCSTPFGITEYIGRLRRCGRYVRCPVLNAFRHHGVYRWVGFGYGSETRSGCSTPFGITEYIGRACGRRSASSCAQRLSASRSISDIGRRDRRAGERRRRVLNAFRHHGVYRSGSPACSSGGLLGAQRLSASRSISAARGSARHVFSHKCSTPFGITEYIGAAPPA